MLRLRVCNVRRISRFYSGIPHETYMAGVNTVFLHVEADHTYKPRIEEQYIDLVSWKSYLNSIRRRVIIEPTALFGGADAAAAFAQELQSCTTEEGAIKPTPQIKETVFSLVLKNALIDMAEELRTRKTLAKSADLRAPPDWYPYTRLMKRNIIFHGGPTNSGKTYQALKRLEEADPAKGGGLFAGPLRLLALEVYEKLNKSGVLCNLATGQEKREVPGATHCSSTVEMVNITDEYDVAVIDEIQMIADEDRGHAWTRALLGLRAREIHVCGGLEAEQVVRSICESTGDNFTLNRYDRLSTLKVEEQSLGGDYSKVQPGDCVVAFSKADIFSIRREIESKTPYKCAIIYGQLPPETRSDQARLFNEEDTGYDILVASDAIGMGLNLNIRRTVFHSTIKYANRKLMFVEPTNVKQIAGRAGRLSSNYKQGLVTAWQDEDLAYVRAVMSFDVPIIESAGVFPSVEQVSAFSESLAKLSTMEKAKKIENDQSGESESANSKVSNGHKGAAKTGKNGDKESKEEEEVNLLDPKNIRLSLVLEKFVELSKVDKRYHMCNHEDMAVTCNWLHTIPLSLEDRFTFACAPVNIKDSAAMTSLYHFAAKYALQQPVALNIRLARELPQNLEEFGDLCVRHSILDLYQWLANRFPKYFIEVDLCAEQRKFATKQIEATLANGFQRNEKSHQTSYQKIRDRMHGKLPAEGYPHIRAAYLEIRAQMALDLPKLSEEGLEEGLQQQNSRNMGSKSRWRERSNAWGKEDQRDDDQENTRERSSFSRQKSFGNKPDRQWTNKGNSERQWMSNNAREPSFDKYKAAKKKAAEV